MKCEKNKCMNNMSFNELVVEKLPNSMLVAAKMKVMVPEKKIILMDQATKQESRFLIGVNINKGGLIV